MNKEASVKSIVYLLVLFVGVLLVFGSGQLEDPESEEGEGSNEQQSEEESSEESSEESEEHANAEGAEEGTGDNQADLNGCVDSDNGVVLDVRGDTSSPDDPNGYQDYCRDEIMLTEYACGTNGEVVETVHDCGRQCVDGTCVGESVPDTNPTPPAETPDNEQTGGTDTVSAEASLPESCEGLIDTICQQTAGCTYERGKKKFKIVGKRKGSCAGTPQPGPAPCEGMAETTCRSNTHCSWENKRKGKGTCSSTTVSGQEVGEAPQVSCQGLDENACSAEASCNWEKKRKGKGSCKSTGYVGGGSRQGDPTLVQHR